MSLWDKVKDAFTHDEAEAAREAKDAKQAADAQALAEAQDAVARIKAKKKELRQQLKAEKADESDEHAGHGHGHDGGTTYTVVKGDTLSGIGAKFGVDWHEIAKINDIENPNLIYPGQEFKIPAKG